MLIELAISLVTAFMAPVQEKQGPVKTEIIFVKESKAPCTGVAPMECLQIKRANDKDWGNWYGEIAGFHYVPGYRYKLKVKVTQNDNPPADASAIQYTLVRILNRTKTNGATNSKDGNAAFSRRWTLVRMNGNGYKDSGIWMEFDTQQQRVHGRSGCNGMMGAYTVSGNNITFSRTAGTLMACPDTNLMRREYEFMKLLGDQTFQYQVSGSTVTLSQNRQPVLQFRLGKKGENPIQSGKHQMILGGKKWVLNKLNDTDIKNSDGMFLQFDPQKKRFSGKGGCNNVSGAYSSTATNITFRQAISTRMACLDNDAMKRENDFLKTLSDKTFRYEIVDKVLNFYDTNNNLVMQFTEESNPPVASGNTREWAFIGSRKWNVIKLNDEVLSNAGIWLDFDTDKKRFNGKAGCNSIAGNYTTNNDEITFSRTISTRMACPDPAVMKRESAFIALLSDRTYRYDIADQTLNLYDKEGKIVIMFGMQSK